MLEIEDRKTAKIKEMCSLSTSVKAQECLSSNLKLSLYKAQKSAQIKRFASEKLSALFQVFVLKKVNVNVPSCFIQCLMYMMERT